jgi:hypothetical protein
MICLYRYLKQLLDKLIINEQQPKFNTTQMENVAKYLFEYTLYNQHPSKHLCEYFEAVSQPVKSNFERQHELILNLLVHLLGNRMQIFDLKHDLFGRALIRYIRTILQYNFPRLMAHIQSLTKLLRSDTNARQLKNQISSALLEYINKELDVGFHRSKVMKSAKSCVLDSVILDLSCTATLRSIDQSDYGILDLTALSNAIPFLITKEGKVEHQEAATKLVSSTQGPEVSTIKQFTIILETFTQLLGYVREESIVEKRKLQIAGFALSLEKDIESEDEFEEAEASVSGSRATAPIQWRSCILANYILFVTTSQIHSDFTVSPSVDLTSEQSQLNNLFSLNKLLR